jgi:two-component system, OmpR family, response regulator RegX3
VDSAQQFIALVLARDPALAATLAAGGFAVAGALTGPEAIHLFDRQQFDLVLLDMDLLRPTSLNACRRIRELAPNVKIIMIADEDAEEDRVRALEAGADDCVNKPLQLRELAARARAVLRLCSPRPARSPTRPSHIDAGQESPPAAASGGETSLPDSEPAKVPLKF